MNKKRIKEIKWDNGHVQNIKIFFGDYIYYWFFIQNPNEARTQEGRVGKTLQRVFKTKIQQVSTPVPKNEGVRACVQNHQGMGRAHTWWKAVTLQHLHCREAHLRR